MLGTGSYGEICTAVEAVMRNEKPLLFSDKNGPVEEIGRVVSTGPGWAYLRIAEGCDNCCAFCAIPAIRGKYRSRPLDAILAEARALAAQGVKELIVIAQDITRWGKEIYGKHINNEILRRMNRRGTGDEIRDLIAKLRHEIPGLVLRTSLIAGLPGETEAEFEELCDWLREVRMERVGVFPFSPEEGTPAAA